MNSFETTASSPAYVMAMHEKRACVLAFDSVIQELRSLENFPGLERHLRCIAYLDDETRCLKLARALPNSVLDLLCREPLELGDNLNELKAYILCKGCSRPEEGYWDAFQHDKLDSRNRCANKAGTPSKSKDGLNDTRAQRKGKRVSAIDRTTARIGLPEDLGSIKDVRRCSLPTRTSSSLSNLVDNNPNDTPVEMRAKPQENFRAHCSTPGPTGLMQAPERATVATTTLRGDAINPAKGTDSVRKRAHILSAVDSSPLSQVRHGEEEFVAPQLSNRTPIQEIASGPSSSSGRQRSQQKASVNAAGSPLRRPKNGLNPTDRISSAPTIMQTQSDKRSLTLTTTSTLRGLLKKCFIVGYVYIQPVEVVTAAGNVRHLMKIGFSKDVVKRCKQICNGCCSATLKSTGDPVMREVKHHERVEQLVLRELEDFRAVVDWECDKATAKGHREFFNVPLQVAMQSMDRWVSFMFQNVYTPAGTIDNFWAGQIEKIPEPSWEEKKAFEEHRLDRHHELRHERLDDWLRRSIEARAQ